MSITHALHRFLWSALALLLVPLGLSAQDAPGVQHHNEFHVYLDYSKPVFQKDKNTGRSTAQDLAEMLSLILDPNREFVAENDRVKIYRFGEKLTPLLEYTIRKDNNTPLLDAIASFSATTPSDGDTNTDLTQVLDHIHSLEQSPHEEVFTYLVVSDFVQDIGDTACKNNKDSKNITAHANEVADAIAKNFISDVPKSFFLAIRGEITPYPCSDGVDKTTGKAKYLRQPQVVRNLVASQTALLSVLNDRFNATRFDYSDAAAQLDTWLNNFLTRLARYAAVSGANARIESDNTVVTANVFNQGRTRYSITGATFVNENGQAILTKRLPIPVNLRVGQRTAIEIPLTPMEAKSIEEGHPQYMTLTQSIVPATGTPQHTGVGDWFATRINATILDVELENMPGSDTPVRIYAKVESPPSPQGSPQSTELTMVLQERRNDGTTRVISTTTRPITLNANAPTTHTLQVLAKGRDIEENRQNYDLLVKQDDAIPVSHNMTKANTRFPLITIIIYGIFIIVIAHPVATISPQETILAKILSMNESWGARASWTVNLATVASVYIPVINLMGRTAILISSIAFSLGIFVLSAITQWRENQISARLAEYDATTAHHSLFQNYQAVFNREQATIYGVGTVVAIGIYLLISWWLKTPISFL